MAFMDLPTKLKSGTRLLQESTGAYNNDYRDQEKLLEMIGMKLEYKKLSRI